MEGFGVHRVLDVSELRALGGWGSANTRQLSVQTTELGLQTTELGLQTTELGLQTTELGLQTTRQLKRSSTLTSGWGKCLMCRWKLFQHWISNRDSVSDRKSIPYVQQEPPEKSTGNRRLTFGPALCLMVVLTFGVVTGIIWSAQPRAISNSVDDSQGRQLDTTTTRDNGMYDRCADAENLIQLTGVQCGGLAELTDNTTDPCRLVHYEARCVFVSLWYSELACPAQAVREAVLWGLSQRRPSIPTDNHLCPGENPEESYGAYGDLSEACHQGDVLYKAARRHCSAILTNIEGKGQTNICRNLEWLYQCLASTLHEHQVSCFLETTPSVVDLATILFPYLKEDSFRSCEGRPVMSACTGNLTDKETQVFVHCSLFLSLQAPGNSSAVNCKIYAYMSRCVERKLRRIGTPCSLHNIVLRLETDLSRVPDLNPHEVRQCLRDYNPGDICREEDVLQMIAQNFCLHQYCVTEDYNPGDICREEDVLQMIAQDFCSKPDHQPFRLTQTEAGMSKLFSQCANFSAMVTCVSEHLTSTGLSCHPGAVESALSRTVLTHGAHIPGVTGPRFNLTRCTGPSAERLCSDGPSILLIADYTCNIAIDFIKQQLTDNFKCSYFRQFVTCVQALLHSRGYECFFTELQNTLIKQHSWFFRNSGFDPSYCAAAPGTGL